MKHKTKALSVCSRRSIREAVCERFQAVCGQDEEQCAEAMRELERLLEAGDEGCCILYFDWCGYPFFMEYE